MAVKKAKKAASGKSLDSDDDIANSRSSLERQDGRILKINIGKTPVYFLDSAYADGFVHWVEVDGNQQRVICAGGVEGKGWAPEACAICKHVAGMYKKAKSMENDLGKEHPSVVKLRKRAYSFKARYEAHFLVAAGEMVIEKRDGKKVNVADFEDAKVGVLSMTSRQYEDFTALRSNDSYPFMKSSKDLTNRVIQLHKAKKDGATFATTEFVPSKSQSDPPEVEYDAAEFNLDDDFEVDEELVAKAATYLEDGGDDEDDDETYEEDDEADDKKPAKKGSSNKKPAKKSSKEAEDDFLEDVDDDEEEEDSESDDEDFEDDDPDEEEAPKKGKPGKKPSKR